METCDHGNSLNAPCGECSHPSAIKAGHFKVEDPTPVDTLSVLEAILAQLRTITELLKRGNDNTGLKRPGVTKFTNK